jgi:hypothetical protein
MTQRLRQIALTVCEPDNGEFMWLLLESDGSWTEYQAEVAAAQEPYDTYDKALMAGLRALQTLSPDPTKGPR